LRISWANEELNLNHADQLGFGHNFHFLQHGSAFLSFATNQHIDVIARSYISW